MRHPYRLLCGALLPLLAGCLDNVLLADSSRDGGVADVPSAGVCTSRPEPLCRRVLTAFSLHFGTSSGSRVVGPTEEAVINEGGSLLCRNRVAYQRTPSGGVECTDLTRPVVSYEIVRQP